ncbi:MAG: hypothetical protein IKB02_04500 [Clostridia bacterium]|nr:hypothetical protein [Clostridia bacterium]
MKITSKILSLVLCLLLVSSLLLTSCGEDGNDTNTDTTDTQTSAPAGDDTEKPSTDFYAGLKLEDYVKLGTYKGLVVDARGSSEDIELWNAIVARCEVIEYPADALSYYTSQTKEKYKIFAERGNMTYEELMKALDKTDADLEKEAKDLIKKDLVTLAIVKAEGLELTDKEKTDLFDMYADVYLELYGYTEEYIRENLSNEVYGSMQHDKMMEYLIKQNHFVAED